MWGYYVQQLICLVYGRNRNEKKFHLVFNLYLTYTNFIIEIYLSITLVQSKYFEIRKFDLRIYCYLDAILNFLSIPILEYFQKVRNLKNDFEYNDNNDMLM